MMMILYQEISDFRNFIQFLEQEHLYAYTNNNIKKA